MTLLGVVRHFFQGPVARWQSAGNQARQLDEKGPLAGYYLEPMPERQALVHEVSILALDFETTGLNPESDDIISVGWVLIESGKIKFSTAGHQIIKPRRDLKNETVPVHGLSHDVVAKAPDMLEMLPTLLSLLKGRALLAHHVYIENGFLHAACQHYLKAPFMAMTIDTLEIERRRSERANRLLPHNGYRLAECRKRYNLPRYKAHNACTDALAAAELFLAQVAVMGGTDKVRMSEVSKYSYQ